MPRLIVELDKADIHKLLAGQDVDIDINSSLDEKIILRAVAEEESHCKKDFSDAYNRRHIDKQG